MQVPTNTPNDLTEQREALYKRLEAQNIEALWRALDAVTPRVPVVQSVPHIWRWRDIKPALSAACDVVTPYPGASPYLLDHLPCRGRRWPEHHRRRGIRLGRGGHLRPAVLDLA